MTSNEIRASFLQFFEDKNHRIVDSAPVIPYDDPTLLFTNAGMNQFKDVFLGIGKRDFLRATDTQKCIRVSGKHNDLEEVGVDTYHHTFFEMLGNWSFGDYYKSEAIQWAWELLTKVWGLPVERIHATVFRTDNEAYEIWKNYLPDSRIHHFDEKDNFWEMGETGPCGPCSEIHFDRTKDLSGGSFVNAGSPDVIEIWNLVFIQFNRRADGSLEELSAKHVDTGMGFERIVSVIQNKNSNYDTDIFMPIIYKIEKISGKKYEAELNHPHGIAMRVIADHLRTLSFAIADGALPSNEGRGYVLRRILRRASRFARNLGFREPVIYSLLPTLIKVMGSFFPELEKNKNIISKVIKAEEDNFLHTLERGLNKFEELTSANATEIKGKDAFLLFDSFGFPLDLTQLIARERNMTVDNVGFETEMEKQRHRSRSARKIVAQEADSNIITENTQFTGYDEYVTTANILYVNQNEIVTDKSPFYLESGGQVSDTGLIEIDNNIYNVINLRKSGNAIIHVCDRNIETTDSTKARLIVNSQRRFDIMRNHSATHLLHEALSRVLGSHVKQAGSLVAPDYLRFDFNHFEKVTNKQLKKIEAIVNEKIFEMHNVRTDILPIEEAKKNSQTKMFFGEKYGDIVRIVNMGNDFSSEFCGGTHVRNTAEIGLFNIISESSIAAGVRRIEAVTGRAVENYIKSLNSKLDDKEKQNETLLSQIKTLKKELELFKSKNISSSIDDIAAKSLNLNGIKLAYQQIEADNLDILRTAGENIRNKLKTSGIGILSTVIDGKIQLVCAVTDDLMKTMPAGKIVGAAAKFLGGGGGGKPHLATAGAKDLAKLKELPEELNKIIQTMKD